MAEYEKLGEVTFDHPEFHRLREKNRRYKETILQLQRGLLLGGSTDRGFDAFSFTSD